MPKCRPAFPKTRTSTISLGDRVLERSTAESLVQLYDAWGKKDMAREWKMKLGLLNVPADVFAQ
jgi:hypothetical protein